MMLYVAGMPFPASWVVLLQIFNGPAKEHNERGVYCKECLDAELLMRANVTAMRLVRCVYS